MYVCMYVCMCVYIYIYIYICIGRSWGDAGREYICIGPSKGARAADGSRGAAAGIFGDSLWCDS